MKFQNRIFALFTVSTTLVLFTTAVFVFTLLKKYNDLYENAVIEEALEKAVSNYPEYSDAGDTETLFGYLKEINREYVKNKILKKDILISGSASLLVFLFLQSVILLLLLFFIIKAVTRQLDQLFSGIKRVRKGDSTFRWPSMKGIEFQVIAGQLNLLLNTLADKEKIIREQSKLAGWQEVSSFLSHQLKNPLTSIVFAKKNIELGIESGGNAEQLRENLLIIEEEATRLNNLVNRLKQLSSFPEPQKSSCSIEQLIRNLVRRFNEESVQFELQLSSSDELMLDRQLMEQVFMNLFYNSIEADSRRKTVIYISSLENDDGVIIKIEDSVTGLPDDITEKLFIPKFTTKKNGMGLGLVFARKIILMHGGNIEAVLNKKNGLAFTIFIPKEKNYG